MKPVPTRQIAPLALLPIIFALGACGGGGGESASSASSSVITPPAVTPPATNSTALKDNAVGSSASFTNFATSALSVPVAEVAFIGTRRFVKVTRSDGATVFLGEVGASQPFSLSVDAPIGKRTFSYEIFSESAADAIVRGEVTL